MLQDWKDRKKRELYLTIKEYGKNIGEASLNNDPVASEIILIFKKHKGVPDKFERLEQLVTEWLRENDLV